jgi:hypothetical protein
MFNPGDTVRVRGANAPMSTQTPPPPPKDDNKVTTFLRNLQQAAQQQRQRNAQAEGINVIPGALSTAALNAAALAGNTVGQTSRFLSGRSPDPASNWGQRIFGGPEQNIFSLIGGGERPTQPNVTDNSAFENSVLSAYNNRPQGEPSGGTFQEWAAANMGQFDSTPYDNYMNFLLQQDEETMARINAMYRELASEAEGNMKRVANVYEGAERGVGDAYDSSQNIISQAYDSSQQQAADQMARLGIEAAAPAVLNPMALSQAEALSNVATGQGAAVGATRQFGATAQDFASQMGQVAQQQGLEVSQQLLRDMARRQAEAAFQRSQAEAEFNPYANAFQELETQNAWNQLNNPQADPRQAQAEADFLYKQEQDDLNLMRQYYNLYYENSNGNEKATREKLLGAIEAGLLGERWRQWAAQNPGVLPPLA